MGNKPTQYGWMRNWKAKLFYSIMGLMMMVTAYFIVRNAGIYVSGIQVEEKYYEWRVVIDAGHGGDDPGKIGINGSKEKDINLEIANKVKEYLEASDIEVVMTRDGAEGLYDANASNKKVQDMKRRIERIDEVNPSVTVSIHQNSYPEEAIHGAQVFYYDGSVEGQKLAQYIQTQLVEKVDPDNKRQIKANDSYYLLKKTQIPIVIVECGFLSNASEAEKLTTEEYQDRVAWAVSMGIRQYLNGME